MILKTSDNRYICVRSPGTGVNENDVRVVMDFEAPNGSSSAWLNTGKFVARRIVDAAAKTMTMKVYDVNGSCDRRGKHNEDFQTSRYSISVMGLQKSISE